MALLRSNPAMLFGRLARHFCHWIIVFETTQHFPEGQRQIAHSLVVFQLQGFQSWMLLHLLQPLDDDLLDVFDQNYAHPAEVDWRMRLSLMQLTLDDLDQLVYVRGFHNVVINLLSDSLQRRLERRISGDDDRNCAGLRAAHRAHDRKPITRLTNVEVRKQDLKLFLLNERKRFRNIGGSPYLKAMHFENGWKSETNARLVIDEQNPGLGHP